MPSFRVTMTIGSLYPGTKAAEVLPLASAAAAEYAMVEASDISVISGLPRVIIRFSADDPEIARQIGRHTLASTSTVADVHGVTITERVGSRWCTR